MPDTTIGLSSLASRIETLANAIGDLKGDMAVMTALLQRIDSSLNSSAKHP